MPGHGRGKDRELKKSDKGKIIIWFMQVFGLDPVAKQVIQGLLNGCDGMITLHLLERLFSNRLVVGGKRSEVGRKKRL